ADAAPAGVVRRQVHDIPMISPWVVEHRLHQRRCGCGQVTAAPAPPGVSAPAVYGPNLRALAAYLVVFQHLPVARAAQLIADVTGARPSTGWISSVLGQVAGVLGDVEKLIKTLITLAHVIHVDETSSNINGSRWWLHVACTETLTAYHLHPSRGRAAVTEFDVLPAFRGTVVHDALAVYDAYPMPGTPCAARTWPASWSPPPRPTPTRTGPNKPSGRCTGSTLPPTMPASSDNTRSRRRSPNRY
ncbi:IS66 family transposase, partial [Pseudonocardia nigra]|uniref:IS66 family transposase n=1 Tax=Pseudonocardia nigra TaxID=1921578 RepID=UPI001C5CCB22